MEVKNSPAVWQGDLENKLGYERIEWKKRMVVMSGFISESDKTVLDLGAGHMHLKNFLKKDVKYIPVDYYKSSSTTYVCDFNKEEFPDYNVDVIFAAGILEYIENPEQFLLNITEHCNKLIISYKGREQEAGSPLYTQEIIDYLKERGFSVVGRDFSLPQWTLIACFERMTPDKLCNQISCSGCGACVNICEHDALELQLDDVGYYKPEFTAERCKKCMRCIQICPEINKVNNKNEIHPKVFAAWADFDTRLKSSSGGAFSVMAKHVLEKGGYVFGAAWTKNYYCEHIAINDSSQLDRIRHSKYVQSNTKKTFQEVKRLIKTGKSVLYVGCPCQIKGLNAFLGEYAGSYLLTTVDLVCIGVPSIQNFRKYLYETYSNLNVSDITFRDKRKEGWSPYGYSVETEENGISYPEHSDSYLRAFHGMILKNETCDRCTTWKFPRIGDVSLGDFWGIEQFDQGWNDGMGTSFISANTSKGELILDKIKDEFCRLEEVPVYWALSADNRIGAVGKLANKNRDLFNNLIRKSTFKNATDIALNNRHDIGLVVMMNYNIGNSLTNLALYSFLCSLNKSVLMIDVASAVRDDLFKIKDDPLYFFLKSPYPQYDLYIDCRDEKDFYNLNTMCDCFVVGSDQIWRDLFIQEMCFYSCLSWVRSNKYMTSYAVSLGAEDEDRREDTIDKRGYFLERFDSISVREEDAIKRLMNENSIKAVQNLDPVFICDRKIYEELSELGSMRIPKDKKYIAAYLLDIDMPKQELVLNFAEKFYDGNYVAMPEPVHNQIENAIMDYMMQPAVEEWLAVMNHSDYIITDSYHGMCFAIIFRKQFSVIYCEKNWRGINRFQSLLKLLGLENRLIVKEYEKNIIENKDNRINYDEIYKRLDPLIDRSRSWLQSEIAMSERRKAKLDDYDMLYEIKLQLKEYIKKQNYEIQEQKRKQLSDNYIIAHFHNKWEISGYIRKRDDMQVIGWGAGKCFYDYVEELAQNGIIQYVCDNNVDLWGKELFSGIKCISPQELRKKENIYVVIMIESAAVTMEIANQLISMGIANFDHIQNWIKVVREG